MEIYIVTIYDCHKGESYVLGAYSTSAKAHEAMDGEMSAVHGQNEYNDWDTDFGYWRYFYEGFTAEIQRTILDDNTDC